MNGMERIEKRKRKEDRKSNERFFQRTSEDIVEKYKGIFHCVCLCVCMCVWGGGNLGLIVGESRGSGSCYSCFT